jgi:phasin
MSEFEIPEELRNFTENTLSQAEAAFGQFIDAVNKSLSSVSGYDSDASKQIFSLTKQNVEGAFEHARKLVNANDLPSAMRIQSEFLRNQFTTTGEYMQKITSALMQPSRRLF